MRNKKHHQLAHNDEEGEEDFEDFKKSFEKDNMRS